MNRTEQYSSVYNEIFLSNSEEARPAQEEQMELTAEKVLAFEVFNYLDGVSGKSLGCASDFWKCSYLTFEIKPIQSFLWYLKANLNEPFLTQITYVEDVMYQNIINLEQLRLPTLRMKKLIFKKLKLILKTISVEKLRSLKKQTEASSEYVELFDKTHFLIQTDLAAKLPEGQEKKGLEGLLSHQKQYGIYELNITVESGEGC